MLNPKQQQVVAHKNGAAIVLATAGSGKTHTMVYRIQSLLDSGVNPASILVATFSKKAVESLQNRLDSITSHKVQAVTIHSLGFSILKDFLKGYEPAIFAFFEQKKIVQDFADELVWNVDFQIILNAISLMKKDLVFPADAEKWLKAKGYGNVENYSLAYENYVAVAAKENKIDYDDMILLPLFYLRNNPGFAQAYKSKYAYGVLDECQDNNAAQLNLILELVKPENLMMVGDDFQSIYAFQGARPDLTIDKFHEDNKASVYLLDTNYRSNQAIIDLANTLAEKMDNPHKKIMLPHKTGQGHVVYKIFNSMEEEARFIVDRIQEAEAESNGQVNWKRHAVLYRMNVQCRAIEEQLMGRNIPYVIFGGDSFYERREVKDVLAYLRLADDPIKYHFEIERIINIASSRFKRHVRMLGQKFVTQYLRTHKTANYWTNLQALAASKSLARYQRDGVLDLINFVESLRKIPELHRKIRYIVDNCYRSYLEHELGMNETDSQDSRIGVLNEIQEVFGKFKTAQQLFGFIYKMMLFEKKKEDPNYNGVHMMTVHKSKGLEWENVYLAGLNDGTLPHIKSGEMDKFTKVLMPGPGYDEERRLCYVGVTRAIDNLFLSSHVNSPSFQGAVPSAFLYEMGIDVQSAQEELQSLQESISGSGLLESDNDSNEQIESESSESNLQLGSTKMYANTIPPELKSAEPKKEDFRSFLPGIELGGNIVDKYPDTNGSSIMDTEDYFDTTLGG